MSGSVGKLIVRRILAILIDIVLFVLYLLAWTIAIVLIAGFCEIIFRWNALEGLIPGGILILLIPTALYFVWPPIKYKRTAGSGLMVKGTNARADFRPLALYGKILGIMIVAYFLSWGISRLAFGAMVKQQEKVVEAMGMSLDWKSYYPPMDSLDNSVPILNRSVANLEDKNSGKLITAINWNPDTISLLKMEIEANLAENKRAGAILDSALCRHKLIWHDYRAMSPLEVYEALPLPNYPGIESLLYLSLLDAVYSGYRGDMERCAQGIDRGIKLLTLQRQDPTRMNLLFLNGMELRTTINSLITVTKVAQDKNKLFPIIKEAHEKTSQISTGLVHKNSQAEFAHHIAFLKEVYNEGPGGPAKSPLQAWSNVVFSLFERIWWPWESYYAMKCAEYTIRETNPDNTFAIIDSIDKEYSKLKDSRMTTTILTTMTVADLRVAEYQKDELIYRAMLDATLLYAAALDYRQKHGTYPESLQQLIPEYLPGLPKSPIDHKDYIYKAKGNFMEVYALGPDGKHIPATTIIGLESQTQSK